MKHVTLCSMEVKNRIMKKRNFFAFTFATLSVVGLVASLVASFKDARPSTKVEAYSDADFTAETELVNGDELTVDISNYSISDYGASLELKFATGSQCLANDTSKYFVVGSTDEFVKDVQAFNELDEEERTNIRYEVADGTRATIYYEAELFRVKYDVVDVYVPRTMSRGVYGYDDVYTGTILTISEFVLPNNSLAERIYIPSEVTTIPASAFSLATHLTDIYVECEEADKPADWADGWNCGATVHWGTLNLYSGAPNKSERMETTLVQNAGSTDVNFIIGYFVDSSSPLPLIVEYKIDGETQKRYQELSKKSTTLSYDAVGAGITAFVQTLNVNIDVERGKNIDPASIVVHNVYKAIKFTDPVREIVYFEPEKDGSDNLVPHFIKPVVGYKRINDLNDFITVKFNSISLFNGYTVINSTVDVVNNGAIYKTIKPGQYEMFKEQLESGAGRYRFRFTSLKNTAKYRFEYNDKVVYKKVDTPTGHYIFDGYKNNNISFAIKDSMLNDPNYSGKNLKAFGLTDMYISVDIVVGNSIYSSTRFEINFGTIYFMNPHSTSKIFDANLFMILTVVIYSALAFGLGTFLFLHYKRKYRNDEFRRLRPKQFIKKGIIYWLTSTAIVIAIESIVLRVTALKNAIVVYNPVDVLIVIFGIASIIIIGYYVKTFTALYKANQQRKKAIKLGMVNETADDGTK